jgi:hypothetical protein
VHLEKDEKDDDEEEKEEDDDEADVPPPAGGDTVGNKAAPAAVTADELAECLVLPLWSSLPAAAIAAIDAVHLASTCSFTVLATSIATFSSFASIFIWLYQIAHA